MASPLYDSVSVQHSRNIGDAVAAAATNGNTWTSVQRDNHLNNAIKRFIRTVVNGNKIRQAQMLPVNYDPIEQYVVISPAVALSVYKIALTAAGFTGGSIDTILQVLNATSNKYVKPLPLTMVMITDSTMAVNSFLTTSSNNQYWYSQGGYLTLQGSGASDNIQVTYVIRHTALSAGGASDLIIDPQYYQTIYDFALLEALQDRPSDKNVARSQQMVSVNQIRSKVD